MKYQFVSVITKCYEKYIIKFKKQIFQNWCILLVKSYQYSLPDRGEFIRNRRKDTGINRVGGDDDLAKDKECLNEPGWKHKMIFAQWPLIVAVVATTGDT